MASPTVSVIVPTRNRLDFLVAAVVSVCAQTRPPDEIIVVEDGSGAAHALQSLRAELSLPLRVLPGPAIGPGAARNAGLAVASGDLIAFLDDDDLWQPTKLAWQVDRFALHPDLGLLGTQLTRWSTGPLPTVPVHAPKRLRFIRPTALLRANRLTTSTVVARRECFTRARFCESLPLAQDWDMWLRLSREWRVAVLPAPLTIYRLHEEQRSGRARELREWEAAVVRRALAEERPGSWRHGVARRRLSWAQCRLGRARLRTEGMRAAAPVLWEALSLNPLNWVAWSTLLRGALLRATPAEVERS